MKYTVVRLVPARGAVDWTPVRLHGVYLLSGRTEANEEVLSKNWNFHVFFRYVCWESIGCDKAGEWGGSIGAVGGVGSERVNLHSREWLRSACFEIIVIEKHFKCLSLTLLPCIVPEEVEKHFETANSLGTREIEWTIEVFINNEQYKPSRLTGRSASQREESW